MITDATHVIDTIDGDLSAKLAALFPGAVGAAGRALSTRIYPLYPIEAEAVRNAVESRRLEFADGRDCARIAMSRIGLPACAVPSGADRAPVWPAGIVGSITHGGGICAAVVADRAVFAGIGIDVEAIGAVTPDLARDVMRDDEISAARGEGQRDGADLASLFFCMKEAAYKACYPIVGEVLEFAQMQILLHPTDPAFTATASTERGRDLRIAGRYLVRDGTILAAAWTR
jgi:4'-phosphopantetheinyl transferase EntD